MLMVLFQPHIRSCSLPKAWNEECMRCYKVRPRHAAPKRARGPTTWAWIELYPRIHGVDGNRFPEVSTALYSSSHANLYAAWRRTIWGIIYRRDLRMCSVVSSWPIIYLRKKFFVYVSWGRSTTIRGPPGNVDRKRSLYARQRGRYSWALKGCPFSVWHQSTGNGRTANCGIQLEWRRIMP